MLNSIRLDLMASKTGLKAAFSLTLAASIALFFHWTLFWWAIFIAFISIQADTGSSTMMMLARIVGTYLGALCGILISLLEQFPWAYYPAISVFVFFTILYSVKRAISWVGILCLIVGVSVIILGAYHGGAVYYAIERCLQISFALVIVMTTLILTRVPRAHKLLRLKVSAVLTKIEHLWADVYTNFSCLEYKNRQSLRQKVESIFNDIEKLNQLLSNTFYETREKNFNTGQCAELIKLMKRLASMIAILSQMAKELKLSDFSEAVQDYVYKADQRIKSAINEIAVMVQEKKISYDPSIDEAESTLGVLFDQKLDEYLNNFDASEDISLTKTAWFSLVNRLFHVLALMRRVTVLMNAEKECEELRQQLAVEMSWLNRRKTKERKFLGIRIRTSLHASLTFLVLVLGQNFFNWSPLITVIGTVAVVFISLSLVLPVTANIGLGIVGALLGGVFSFFSMWLLSDYPFYAVVLSFLFIATFISSYLITVSREFGKRFFIFAIYFSTVVVYSLVGPMSARDGVIVSMLVGFALLLGTVLFSVISRFIFPCDYKQLLQYDLRTLLLQQAKLLRKFRVQSTNPEMYVTAQQSVLALMEAIKRAQKSMQYCVNQEIYSYDQVKKINALIYCCELMALCDLNILYPYRVTKNFNILEKFQQKADGVNRLITSNLLSYALSISRNKWSRPVIKSIEDHKQELDGIVCSIMPSLLASSSRVAELRTLSMVYVFFKQLFDIQIRLLNFEGFKF